MSRNTLWIARNQIYSRRYLRHKLIVENSFGFVIRAKGRRLCRIGFVCEYQLSLRMHCNWTCRKGSLKDASPGKCGRRFDNRMRRRSRQLAAHSSYASVGCIVYVDSQRQSLQDSHEYVPPLVSRGIFSPLCHFQVTKSLTLRFASAFWVVLCHGAHWVRALYP